MSRDERVDALLAEFDRLKAWRGICYFAEKYGVSRQWVAFILKKRRPVEYGKKRHPTIGKRNDLGR